MANIPLKCKKRLVGEIRILKKDPHEFIDISPDSKDMLTWYFLIKGPPDCEYTEGYYIGKIMYAPTYPDDPPDFMMLTPNGRFLTNEKICLSNSTYHSDEWSPEWTIHGTLNGFLSIMTDDRERGVSHISRSVEERKQNALESIEYNRTHHMDLLKSFKRFIGEDGYPKK